MDLISVIVPIYNVEPYLDRCVRSIVEQTYTNLEIILVDDGSPDNCPAICDAWAEKDSRIKVIHKENGGLSDARNAGLVMASGELISFIDSDDWIEPTFYEKLWEVMQTSGAEIAACATIFVAEDGEALRIRQAAPASMGKMEALRRLVMEDGVYQTVWNMLYRREVMDGIPFEKGKYNEDEFWTYRVLDRIERLATVSAPLYNYRQRGTSIIGTGYNIRRMDGLEARFRRMEYLQKYEELACLTRQQFTFDCMWHLQCVLKNLSGEEQQQAKETVLRLLRQTPKVSWNQLTANAKYKVWYGLFRVVPIPIAVFRNLLKIGL